MRVVLDTNILVRAAGSSGSPAREVLSRLLEPVHSIIASSALLDEVRRVMNYPRVQKIHGLGPKQVEVHVRDLEISSELVDLPVQVPSQVRHDPDDDPIVATAVYGRAEVLCTLDRHLREPQVVAYCGQFGIRILTDLELLAVLREGDSESP